MHLSNVKTLVYLHGKGIGGEHLSHMGYSTRSVMSEELYKEQEAGTVLDAESVSG